MTDAGLALTVMAHNLGRAVGQLAGPDLHQATAATLRRKVFTMPGRPGPPGPDPHHCDPAALLTTTPAPTTRNSEKPADRQLTPARGSHQQQHHNRPITAPHPPRSTVDPG